MRTYVHIEGGVFHSFTRCSSKPFFVGDLGSQYPFKLGKTPGDYCCRVFVSLGVVKFMVAWGGGGGGVSFESPSELVGWGRKENYGGYRDLGGICEGEQQGSQMPTGPSQEKRRL